MNNMGSMNRSIGRVVALAALAAVTLGAGTMISGEARADKLIFFKNGKALRVKSVKEDGSWLRCELEAKNILSVPNSGVLSIVEAAAPAREAPMNQVAVGTGTPYTGRGGGGAAEQPPDYAATAAAAAEAAEAEAAAQEQAGVVSAAGVPRAGFGRNAAGRRGGVGAQPNAVNNPMLPGFQPLNQANGAFPNRGGRSLNQQQQPLRTNPARIRTQVPQQLQPNNGAEESENN